MNRLLLIFGLVTCCEYTFGCSCAPRNDTQRLSEADYVYVGIADDPVVLDGVAVSTINVEEVLKGVVLSPRLLSVPASTWMCDVVLNAGARYIVYAKNGADPFLSVCSDSSELRPHNADSRIEKLRIILKGREN